MSDPSFIKQIAALADDIALWLRDCSPITREHRLACIIDMLTPDICVYCGQTFADHDELVKWCPNQELKTNEFERLRPKARR